MKRVRSEPRRRHGRRLGTAIAVAGLGLVAGLGTLTTIQTCDNPAAEITMEQQYGLENTDVFEARYPGELQMIIDEVERRTAMYPEMYGDATYNGLIALVMATRMAENGRPGREYGIMPDTRGYPQDTGVDTVDGFVPYTSGTQKQIAWCVGDWQEENRDQQIQGDAKSPYVNDDLWDDVGFIRAQASEYAPVDAGNDPEGLNENWLLNVMKYARMFSQDL